MLDMKAKMSAWMLVPDSVIVQILKAGLHYWLWEVTYFSKRLKWYVGFGSVARPMTCSEPDLIWPLIICKLFSAQQIRLWNLPKRTCIRTITAHEGFVRGLCYHPSGEYFFSVRSAFGWCSAVFNHSALCTGWYFLSCIVRNNTDPFFRDKWLFTRTSNTSFSSYPSDKWKFITTF